MTVIGARKGHTETQIHDLHEYTVRVEGCDAMRERAVTAERERDDLLAIIHRDGGHYVGEHGISKSVADAHATWAAVVSDRDRLRHEAQQLRDRMRRLDPGAFVLAEEVAEALGDMLDGDDARS